MRNVDLYLSDWMHKQLFGIPNSILGQVCLQDAYYLHETIPI